MMEHNVVQSTGRRPVAAAKTIDADGRETRLQGQLKTHHTESRDLVEDLSSIFKVT